MRQRCVGSSRKGHAWRSPIVTAIVEDDSRRSYEPLAVTLRYLQTLTEIATEKNSTILFPIPVELLNLLKTKPPRGDDGDDPTT